MHIVTFYSFKGGVGRTMALVNVAVELTNRGRRVLVVDFDLEAPGVQTYPPFLHGKNNRGIVEYITDYIDTGDAPDVSQFIIENSIEDKSIWLMSSGFQDSQYADRLNSIDWLKLYNDYDGYLMFEDLKQQWKSMRFDYVLIDSRTGHTDVGGICTRQLPDAAVLMFLPNDQNITGLEVVAETIKTEGAPPRNKSIYCHFCPSNVPDLDDEDLVLQRHLEEAKQRLGYSDVASIIHHYASLSLLDQTIFIKDRPRTRLADEYRKLVEAIIAVNIEDKSGAVSKLSKLREALKGSESGQSLEIERTVRKISEYHPDDGEIAWLASQIYLALGDSESELTQLNIAIRHRFMETRARSRRAVLLTKETESSTMREDLRFVVRSPEARASEIASSLKRLRAVDDDWLDVAAKSPAIKRLKQNEMAGIAEALTQDRVGARLAAKLLIEKAGTGGLGPTSVSHSNIDVVLALIAAGEYKRAIQMLGDRQHILRARRIEDAFNLASAEWAMNGDPPLDVFKHVKELAEQEGSSEDPNFLQCLALTYYVLGNAPASETIVRQAKEVVSRRVHETVFSCWRYLWTSSNEFTVDLQEMEGQIRAREKLVPSYFREPALSVE